ncbi:MAG TPA: efflux RND transporter periplasmic adaptor subunit [Gemmatimonadaceae bacterium]|nr:efflux RND transporter periplasmic adaptor subunit [Gemmatimonadaceae bacterium]
MCSFRRVAAVLVVGVAACSKSSATTAAADSAKAKPGNFTVSEDQLKKIHIDTVQTTAFRPSIDATGNVAFNGNKSTQVLSPVSGPATRVIGDVGMHVTAGQPLAYVTSPDFASAVADYRKAQTAYKQAKRTADRDSALFKNDALARADLEQSQTDLASAEADVESSVQEMRSLGVEDSQIQAVRDGRTAQIEAIVRSPIEGTVVEKLIADGQLLQAGTTPCFTIADLSTMWVMANVYADDIRDVSVGQEADVLTDASPVPLIGHVDYIAALADPGTKSVQVRVLVPNSGLSLRRDMFVRVALKSTVQHSGILVPTSSVLRDDENLPFVFIAAANGGFVRRRVDLGHRVGESYEITSGLASGDRVVAEGALFLQFAESQ